MLLLSDLLIICSKVTIETVIIWQEVRRSGVWVVQQGIVHVFVIRAYSLPESHLLDSFSVLLPCTLFPSPRLHIVICVIELSGIILILLLLHLSIWVVVLLLHS